jgi:hypothetical protein
VNWHVLQRYPPKGLVRRVRNATERVPEVSGRDASWIVHYALIFLLLTRA